MDPGIQSFLYQQIPACCGAFLLSILLSKLCIFIGLRCAIADQPGGRKKHQGTISRLGGAALVISFMSTLFLSGLWPFITWGSWLGLGIFSLTGLIDDRYDIGPWQFIGQIAGTLAIIAGGTTIEFFRHPLTGNYVYPGIWGIVATIGWILLLINAINWFDGLDGLAVGTALIATVTLLMVSLRIGHFEVVQLLLVTAALLFGFWLFNLPPAKIFLGTIGVNFLGYLFGTLSIQGGAKVATTFLVLALPILDVGITIIRRILLRKKIYLPDQQHLFHQLQQVGFSPHKILALLYVITLGFGLVALWGNAIHKILTMLAAFFLLLGLQVWAEKKKKSQ